MLPACADPCVDDGLGQEFCPEDQSGGGSGTSTDGGTGDGTGTGSDTDPGASGGGGDACPLLDVELTPQTPTMVLLVDQSGSMSAMFDTMTRWEAVETTLLDPTNGVVSTLQSDIRFGLALYTGYSADPDAACPFLTEADPALDNYDPIKAVFDDAGPADDTPTGESLQAVADNLAQRQEPGDKHIVLATDGEPDTCEIPDPQSDTAREEARQLSIEAAESAYGSGIKVSIISVGSDVGADHLQDMANAGAGVGPGDPDAPYYQALDQQTLVDSFEEIISGVRECTITLQESVSADSADQCVVTVNGDEVPYDDPNGWQLPSSMEIELQGSACDSIQEGTVSIEMECDCSAVEG